MRLSQKIIDRHISKPIANVSFAMMHRQVRAIEKRGITMMHTARPFSYYRKVFYDGESAPQVLDNLAGKTVVDVGCGYTPYADDSMFQACRDTSVNFFGVDPLIGTELKFGIRERALARAMGSRGHFNANAPGLANALSAYAQELPFEDNSVDELLCSYLLFVWIEDQNTLADILAEFLRVLKPGGKLKLYPLYEWRFTRLRNPRLNETLEKFDIEQRFVHGGLDFRITPSLLTIMTKT